LKIKSLEELIMEKVGFIGYGNMGSVILNGFLSSKAIKPDKVILSTRTKSKIDEIQNKYPEIEIAGNNRILASKSDLIFLLVGTSDVKDVLLEIKEFTSDNTHIVYISAALTMENVEGVFNGKVTKVIPSVTSEVFEGVSLVCHNLDVEYKEALYVNNLLSSIGDVKIVNEKDFDVGADITSCAPAFIARIFMEFSRRASLNSGFTRDEAEKMVIKTLYGTSKMLYENDIGFEELISNVATKGGITEEGIKGLDVMLPEIFKELFNITQNKHEIIKEELKNQYV
jgi:pyrroline-5-carboxylate reductase